MAKKNEPLTEEGQESREVTSSPEVVEAPPPVETPVVTQEVTAPTFGDAPLTDTPAPPDDGTRPVSLLFFAQTNAWYVDNDGVRRDAQELMGGFVYQMGLAGRLADTEAHYRQAFEVFVRS